MCGLKSEKAAAAIAESGVQISYSEALTKVQTLAEISAMTSSTTVHATKFSSGRSKQPKKYDKELGRHAADAL